MPRNQSQNVDTEDAALQAAEQLAEIRAQISREKARLAEIQNQSAQAITGKQISPEQAALQKELKNMNRLQATYLKAQVEWAASGKNGMPPHYLKPLTGHGDESSVPMDPKTGKSPVPEGMVPVWVSCYDREGRDAAEPPQVRHRKRQGYHVATFEDGAEVRDAGLGVLMYASPRDAAEWTTRKKPEGAVNPADYFAAKVEQYAEDENRVSGKEVLRTRRFREHGSHSTLTVEDEEEAAGVGGSSLYQP